jgi:hypothetical protein
MSNLGHAVGVRNLLGDGAWAANCACSLFLTVLGHTVSVRLFAGDSFAAGVWALLLNDIRAPLAACAAWVAGIADSFPVTFVNTDGAGLLNLNHFAD